ncbi:hypothetical protein NIES2119_08880 [[Phormidium ambiguum] IAM M-71]|uniref:Uncharacterized protein n=1 Tax=[Phormidium ambiguum] IAM M-71 TaxID=454136 RepID=A0A1U7IN78_9CYAN|nr:hypothetical protein [Phormidium ambiguum]OKH38699.1 hypothetical protein NIES2119_08880 [Phormidium ambiguum IAM M-71]
MKPAPLTEEQQAKLAEALETALAAEEKAKEMSELATAIAAKYQKLLHETALAVPSKENINKANSL